MSALEKILGDKLLNGSGNVNTSTLNDVPAIAIYFSAHWCPPCKMFTPKLVKYYKEANASSKKLEVVFVSGDEEEEEFQDYFGEMPWLALPFDEEKSSDVMAKFKVNGIPALVVVNKDGEVISAKGREHVEGGSSVDEWAA